MTVSTLTEASTILQRIRPLLVDEDATLEAVAALQGALNALQALGASPTPKAAEEAARVCSHLAAALEQGALEGGLPEVAALSSAAVLMRLARNYCTDSGQFPYTRGMNATTTTPRVLLYTRVSTDEQAASGLGLQDQLAALTADAERRKWADVEHVSDEGYSAKSLDRPGIRTALERLSAGEADVLAVTKLDRLSRSVLDFAGLVERSRREGWSLVVLDLGVDTTSAAGDLVANVMASVAQWERRVIGERTSAALRAKRRRGEQVGRPVEIGPDTDARIRQLRAQGESLRAIADRLNAEGHLTPRGGPWRHSTVQYALDRMQRQGGTS